MTTTYGAAQQRDDNGAVLNKQSSFAQIIQTPDNSTQYICLAKPGSLSSAAVWQVQKVVTSGTTQTITWADGNDNFDNVADNYATLTYS